MRRDIAQLQSYLLPSAACTGAGNRAASLDDMATFHTAGSTGHTITNVACTAVAGDGSASHESNGKDDGSETHFCSSCVVGEGESESKC